MVGLAAGSARLPRLILLPSPLAWHSVLELQSEPPGASVGLQSGLQPGLQPVLQPVLQQDWPNSTRGPGGQPLPWGAVSSGWRRLTQPNLAYTL